MRIQILICFIFITSHIAFSQQAQYTLKDYNLKGNVKSVKTQRFNTISPKGNIQKTTQLNDGNSIIYFNNSGQKTEQVDLDGEGKTTFFTHYKYQGDKILSEAAFKKDSTLIRNYEYFYTPENNLNWMKKTYSNNEVVAYYIDSLDSKGMVYRSFTLDKDSSKVLKIFDFYYNENGTLKFVSRGDASRLEITKRYKYDDRNQVIGIKTTDSESNSTTFKYTYDDYGNMASITVYDDSDNLTDSTMFEFTYDKFNNWIQKISRSNDGKFIEERTIEYW